MPPEVGHESQLEAHFALAMRARQVWPPRSMPYNLRELVKEHQRLKELEDAHDRAAGREAGTTKIV